MRIRFPDFRAAHRAMVEALKPTVEDARVLGNEGCDIIYWRTVVEGKDKFGQEFAPYSTKPMYVSGRLLSYGRAAGGRDSYLARGRTRATGKKTRKGKEARTGKMRSVYLPGGYKQLKDGVTGPGMARSGVVNLTLTGDMMGSAMFADGASDAAFGLVAADEHGFRIAFTRAESAKKMDGLIERGRDPWGLAIIPAEKEHLGKLLGDRLAPRVRHAVSEALHGRG